MAGAESLVDVLVRTFGPFLIPVSVFAVGFVGYTVLFLVTRYFRSGEDAGVVNLSAGPPAESATGDPDAPDRGLAPGDLEEGEDDTNAEGGERTDGETPRHDD